MAQGKGVEEACVEVVRESGKCMQPRGNHIIYFYKIFFFLVILTTQHEYFNWFILSDTSLSLMLPHFHAVTLSWRGIPSSMTSQQFSRQQNSGYQSLAFHWRTRSVAPTSLEEREKKMLFFDVFVLLLAGYVCVGNAIRGKSDELPVPELPLNAPDTPDKKPPEAVWESMGVDVVSFCMY